MILKICAQVAGLVSLTVAVFCPTTALAWRSTLYPANWQPSGAPAANFETDKLIQDFSYAGYKTGGEALPVVVGPIFNVMLPPYNADNTGTIDATAAIQSAINAAQAAGGGVVLLPAGNYSVRPQGANSYALQITAANVVLRGAGIGTTFLLNTSTSMRSKSIILISGPSAAGFYSSGAASTAISQNLPGPTLEIPVASTNGFATGQWVVVRADCTDAWVTEHNEPGWIGYGNQLRGVAYFRRVTGISAKAISINAPTRYYLKTRDNARVVRLSSGPLLNCGLENFSIGNLQHNGTGWTEDDYNVAGTGGYDTHDSFAIRVIRARDSWVRNVATFQPAGNTNTCHLLSNGILLSECSQITLTNCHFQRSQYGGAGGNGYMYRLQNVNECLLDNCQSTFTRHGFVISHMGASGNVFHECVDKDSGRQTGNTGAQGTAGANSDHHMHFSHANLVDACTGDGSGWEARYRPYGSAPLHNLTAAHSVYWNTRGSGSGPGYVVQTEQSRYGYAIGTRGTRTGVSLSTYGGTKCVPPDHVEGVGLGDTLEPFSLYADQLNRRLHRPHVMLPGSIRLGFPTNSLRLQPIVQIGGLIVTNGFIAEWRTVSAPGPVLFSSTNVIDPVVTFADRGTNELEVIVTANGQQASARVTVLLAWDSAPATETLTPEADTYLRDGSYGDDNYGTQTVLQIKKNTVAGFSRRAFLRFNLMNATLPVFDRAYLQLASPAPPAPGTGPTLQLLFVTNDVWAETALSWNSQPPLGQVITNWPMSSTGTDQVDVTTAALNEATNDGQLSLSLQIFSPFSDSVYSFSSREAAESVRPRLVLEQSDASVAFTDWIAGFPNLAATDPGANPDGDRLTNAEEFLFVRNPAQADGASTLAPDLVPGGIRLRFPQRKHLPPGFYYVIETTPSLSLANWQPAQGVEFSHTDNPDETVTMTAFIPIVGSLPGFYRLRIVISS